MAVAFTHPITRARLTIEAPVPGDIAGCWMRPDFAIFGADDLQLAILTIVLAYTWVIDPIAPGWVVSIPVALVIGLAIWHALRTGDWE
jgi:hypothetical protein